MAASYETVRERRIGEDSLAVFKGDPGGTDCCFESRGGRTKELRAVCSGSSLFVQVMLETGCNGCDGFAGSPLDDVTGFSE